MVKEGLKPGLKNVIVKTVREEHTAKFLGSGGVNVLATPAMITWMEECSRLLVEKYLDDNEATVGTHVDVYHKAPAPLSSKVTVESELIQVDGRRLVFKVRAYSGSITIGEGMHERYIVDLNKFMTKVEKIKESMEMA
ncbi:thioesterase [Candidatus Woesearchaeota archaeon]|nr:MAG: thioesterase [Candidatus Woesearchaeota archaeon]